MNKTLSNRERPQHIFEHTSTHLCVCFEQPMLGSSWAILGGGQGLCLRVVNKRVSDNYLKPPVTPETILRNYCDKMGWSDPIVGMLTSADIARYTMGQGQFDQLEIQCVVTVGLGNALRIGDPVNPSLQNKPGTINTIVWSNQPVHRTAHWEAMSMISEARTAAVLDAGIMSKISGKSATGTGTDCQVFLSPISRGGLVYSGKHTRLGAVLGETVYDTIRKGIDRCLK